MTSIFDIELTTLTGESTTLEPYRGKVLLIVNTASNCGFTPQYAALESLYRRYAAKGLVVLGFPCNQFGAQEPGTDEEIRQFCDSRYEVTFPMFSKIDVNGDAAHPLYVYVKSHDQSTADDAEAQRIKWNFTKFLVDRDGNVVKRLEPTALAKHFSGDIEALL